MMTTVIMVAVEMTMVAVDTAGSPIQMEMDRSFAGIAKIITDLTPKSMWPKVEAF